MSGELNRLYPTPTPDPIREAGRACNEAYNTMIAAEVFALLGDEGSQEKLSKARKAYAQTHEVLTDALAKCDFCKPINAFDLAISEQGETK